MIIDQKLITDHLAFQQIDPSMYGIQSWLASIMAANNLGKNTLYSRESTGFISSSAEEFVKEVGEGLNKIVDCNEGMLIFKDGDTLLVFSNDGIFDEGGMGVSILTTNKEKIERFEEVCKNQISKTKKNVVSILSSGFDGVYFTPIGSVNTPLVRENYNSEVLSGYDFVAKELKSSNPFGRLTIVNGPPGTGKSYMIRGLIDEASESTIVILPAKMISEIDGPSLIPAFLNHKRKKNSPLIAIVEDADACLVPRAADNMSSISSLLNYTDGLLGSLLDLKVIATTNQDHLDFDPALVRAGRLSRHIEVNALTNDEANTVYKRLTDEDGTYTKSMILADIYADAIVKTGTVSSDNSADPNFDPSPGRRLKKFRRLGFGA